MVAVDLARVDPRKPVPAPPPPRVPALGDVVVWWGGFVAEAAAWIARPALILMVHDPEDPHSRLTVTVFRRGGSDTLDAVPYAPEPRENHWSSHHRTMIAECLILHVRFNLTSESFQFGRRSAAGPRPAKRPNSRLFKPIYPPRSGPPKINGSD